MPPKKTSRDVSARVRDPGFTPSVRDLQTVMRRDRVRIELLVMASVLLILLLLLRQLLVSVYLLLSVLFSYYATLGTSFLVFWLFDPQGFVGIDLKVAIACPHDRKEANRFISTLYHPFSAVLESAIHRHEIGAQLATFFVAVHRDVDSTLAIRCQGIHTATLGRDEIHLTVIQTPDNDLTKRTPDDDIETAAR